MKTVLVDAVFCFVNETGTINSAMHELLKTYPHRKIILTGANDLQMKQFNLDTMPYEVFTLKHDPEKTDPSYYKKMLSHFNLTTDDVVYFEHAEPAVQSARSVGINTYHYDEKKQDLDALKAFLDENVRE